MEKATAVYASLAVLVAILAFIALRIHNAVTELREIRGAIWSVIEAQALIRPGLYNQPSIGDQFASQSQRQLEMLYEVREQLKGIRSTTDLIEKYRLPGADERQRIDEMRRDGF